MLSVWNDSTGIAGYLGDSLSNGNPRRFEVTFWIVEKLILDREMGIQP